MTAANNRVPAGVREGGQWATTQRQEPGISLHGEVGQVDAQVLETVHKHLDDGYREYATLAPLLADADLAAERVSAGLPKEQLLAARAERAALRSLVDSTPVGMACLEADIASTRANMARRDLPHVVNGLLLERQTALTVRRQAARASADDGRFAAYHDEPASRTHLEAVCTPVHIDDVEHLVISVVNVQERTEVGRTMVPAHEVRTEEGGVPRSRALAAALDRLPAVA